MKIVAVGCEYALVDGWEDIMPAIKAPSNYKKPEAISGFIEKRLAELHAGKANADPVIGSVVHAVIVDGDGKGVLDAKGEHAGADALLSLSDLYSEEAVIVFGFRLSRTLRLMALDLALRDSELPTKVQKAVDSAPAHVWQRDFVDPVSVLFGSSDMDLGAIARRVGYYQQDLDSALGLAKFALALGGLLGLGG